MAIKKLKNKEKRSIELNGVANARLLLDSMTHEFLPPHSKSSTKMKEQLILLERYMIAYNKAVNNNKPTPNWHDITANPNKYPTNNEI